MRRVIPWLSALVLLSAVLPARACINDREVERAEREFKSQYLQTPPAEPPTSEPAPQSQGLPIAFLGGGTVLLLGATMTVLNLRKRSMTE
jgi:hypothetical protein